MLSAFLKICSILLLVCGSIYLVDQFFEAIVIEQEMSTWTQCERLCYPSAVEEQIENKKCLCSPEIKDRK